MIKKLHTRTCPICGAETKRGERICSDCREAVRFLKQHRSELGLLIERHSEPVIQPIPIPKIDGITEAMINEYFRGGVIRDE